MCDGTVYPERLYKALTEKIAATDHSGYTLQYPPLFLWGRTFSAGDILASIKRLLVPAKRHFGLYVHIPFCREKCLFCRYYSLAIDKTSELDRYLDALEKEMRTYGSAARGVSCRTLYIGGGTPAIFSLAQLRRLFGVVRDAFDLRLCEQIAFEGNADFLDTKKLRFLAQAGVDRLTLGVQSLDPRVIRINRRYQSARSFHRCFRAAREAGIRHINVDLMAGLPGQNDASLARTVEAVLSLRPDMIHVHPFYPTSLTGFMKEGGRITWEQVQARERMIEMCRKRVQARGYFPLHFDALGITPGAYNKQLSDSIEHLSAFLGLGAGAVSHLTGNYRFANEIDVMAYGEKVARTGTGIAVASKLTLKDEMVYYVTSCLRYGPVDDGEFTRLFGRSVQRVFPKEIRSLARLGKISWTGTRIEPRFSSLGEYLVYSKTFYGRRVFSRWKPPQRAFLRAPLPERQIRSMLL
jgi:oxygen-independent coproporphyrinogen III oxidase